VDAIKQEVERSGELLARLEQVTLTKAFRGELTAVNIGRTNVVG
jgi:hypothetical protein